jgi:putative ABC transport system permease protein
MIHLSRHTVRQGWPPYVGSAVAMSLGVTLIFLTVNLLKAVDATSSRAGLDQDVKTQLGDLATLFGMMSSVSMFMALFVVASTFGFVVASRRRELGLLRLVGATPRQVRRLVLGESLVVAVLSAAIGCGLGLASTPAMLWLLDHRGITPVLLGTPSPWTAILIAAPTGMTVALVGAWRASRRAARITPMAALLESSVERRRISVAQLVVGVLCLGSSATAIAMSSQLDPLFALVASILVPEVAVIGLVCFGGVLFPFLAGWLAAPFVHRNVAARLARDQVRAAARTTASTAAPILAIAAIAGAMILSISFTADWTTALDREQLSAQIVVETEASPVPANVIASDPDVAVVDQRSIVTAGWGPEKDPTPVEGIDPAAAAAGRGLTAAEGSLDTLAQGGAAISQSFVSDSGVHRGDRLVLHFGADTVRLRVGAIVKDAPDLHEDVMIPIGVLRRHAKHVVSDTTFVALRDGADPLAVRSRLAVVLPQSEVLGSADWIDQVDARNRKMNEIGLWVLLGPSGVYAGIGVVNTILMGALQRRRELEVLRLVGATRSQLRRTALWEAGLVGTAALVVGGVVTGVLGWMVRHAIAQDVDTAALTIPWIAMVSIVVTALGLVLAAGLTGSIVNGRRRATA